MTHLVLNAHLLANVPSYRRAGIHQYLYNVLAHLPVDGTFDYTILANHQLDIALPIQLGAFNTTNPAQRIIWEQAIQPFTLAKLKPDLYHAMAFVAPRWVRSPFVVTVFDLSFMRYPQVLTRSRRLYLQTFTKESCQRATRVLAISQSTADDLTQMMGIDPTKIDIAYPGVSSTFCPLPEAEITRFRQQKNLPERFLFFVGTLEPRKNLPMLIRAYAALPAEYRQQVHLVLGGGKGWLYDEIFATIAQLDLADTVHTPGYIPADELNHWYNAAMALVYPALYEGFGIPVLEALACGLPAFISNTSSLPEAGGHVSTLLPPDDEAAWTTALQHFIETPDHDPLARQARQDWAAGFTWQRTAEQTVASYHLALKHA